MTAAPRDYYEVLGTSRSAKPDEIKAAYRKLARKYHPDVNRNDKSAEGRFKEVQEAYDVLSDPKKRQAYDQFGHAGVSSAAASEAAAAAAAAGRGGGGFRYQRPTPGGATMDFGEVDLDDIFATFARGPGRGRSRGRTQTSAVPVEPPAVDIVHPVTLTFEQAARGTKLDLRFDTVGKAHSETISVKIPAGVTEGSKIRVKGRGQHTANGLGRGDLIIVTHVSPHDYFSRQGQDIVLDLPISLTEAVAGGTVRVPTLDGAVELRIPAGVTSGKKLRIKGRGITMGDTPPGDQLCRILVHVPEQLTDLERKSLIAIDAAHPADPRNNTGWRF